jgi:hypothetical protein
MDTRSAHSVKAKGGNSLLLRLRHVTLFLLLDSPGCQRQWRGQRVEGGWRCPWNRTTSTATQDPT